eukprot:CAMPEP_0174852202 /NCGR_PEP_ID=MMETSP1114-20130205/25239_1 /TAXON_ID=312471 /ORGANISM="Neobodo designis, Strain CCAP 1951/1" /LENGTH=639 /DNA_ID=CAMNT_0016086781 /DNA_START=43 /DNA_END=1962 /DNA_ORIENTATION=-
MAHLNHYKPPAFEWSQDDSKLEVRVPLSALGASIAPKSLTVEVKEKDILVAKHQDSVVLQQRLHDNVEVDQWNVEDGDTLVVDLKKLDNDSWPCLLRLPMRPDDPRIVRGDDLDALLRTEMTRLPRDEELEKEAAAADAAADDDFDDMLEDALDEVTAAEKKEAEAKAAAEKEAEEAQEDGDETEQSKHATDYELKMTAEEFEQLANLRKETEEKLAADETTEEEKEKLRDRRAMIDKMVELSKKVRRLRSKRPTMPVLLEILQCEIWKGRLNHGALEETETEGFRDDEEKNMSADELLKKGVSCLESDIEDAMHYLRLAAIHHDHPVSTSLLQRLYSQMRVLPKAAYFVMRRALKDDMEPSSNLIVGEFADKGMPLFPPYMALVVYFYQRSATVGSTHAMLTLANTYKQGAVTASPADETSRKKNADEDKFLDWLAAAEERGSPRAYFIRASLHTTGECGQTKSAKLAKQYLDKVKRTEPSILTKAPGLENRINQMLREEAGEGGMPELEATSGSKPASPASASGAGNGIIQPRQSAASRLQQLEAATGGASSAVERPSRAGGMLSKRANNAAANKWKGRLEKCVRIGVGCYFAYCMIFPVRVVLAQQAFETMAYFMELFGLGAYIAGGGARGAMMGF